VASFGENLRRERELRGISLEEIAASTKIKVGFLEAMEKDELARLPGGIFARGFMRTYASYLGLDADQFIAEYQAAAQPKDYELSRLKSANRAAPPDKPRPPVLPFLVAAAMLIGGYSVFHYSHRAADVRDTLPTPIPAPASPPASAATNRGPATNQGAAAPTTATQPEARKRSSRAVADNAVAGKRVNAAPVTALATPPTAPATTPVDQAPERRSLTGQASTAATEPSSDAANAEANQPGSAPANAAAPQSDQGSNQGLTQGLVLKLAVTQPVWVSVDADGKTSLQRVLSPNHVATLKARDSFDVTTGNAQAVTLTLNGQTLKPLGGKDEVKRVHLTQDDAKNPSP